MVGGCVILYQAGIGYKISLRSRIVAQPGMACYSSPISSLPILDALSFDLRLREYGTCMCCSSGSLRVGVYLEHDR